MFLLVKLYKNAKQKTPYICSSSQYMYKYVLSLLSTTQGPQYTLVGHWSAVCNWTHWRRQITVEGFCNQCTKRATSISQFTPHPSFFFKNLLKRTGARWSYIYTVIILALQTSLHVSEMMEVTEIIHQSQKEQTERVWPVRQSVLKLTAHYSQN